MLRVSDPAQAECDPRAEANLRDATLRSGIRILWQIQSLALQLHLGYMRTPAWTDVHHAIHAQQICSVSKHRRARTCMHAVWRSPSHLHVADCAICLRSPCSYTTDFDEMEQLFAKHINPNLDMTELDACLTEFRNDYNKVHFVRNEQFPVSVLAPGHRAACVQPSSRCSTGSSHAHRHDQLQSTSIVAAAAVTCIAVYSHLSAGSCEATSSIACSLIPACAMFLTASKHACSSTVSMQACF